MRLYIYIIGDTPNLENLMKSARLESNEKKKSEMSSGSGVDFFYSNIKKRVVVVVVRFG